MLKIAVYLSIPVYTVKVLLETLGLLVQIDNLVVPGLLLNSFDLSKALMDG